MEALAKEINQTLFHEAHPILVRQPQSSLEKGKPFVLSRRTFTGAGCTIIKFLVFPHTVMDGNPDMHADTHAINDVFHKFSGWYAVQIED